MKFDFPRNWQSTGNPVAPTAIRGAVVRLTEGVEALLRARSGSKRLRLHHNGALRARLGVGQFCRVDWGRSFAGLTPIGRVTRADADDRAIIAIANAEQTLLNSKLIRNNGQGNFFREIEFHQNDGMKHYCGSTRSALRVTRKQVEDRTS